MPIAGTPASELSQLYFDCLPKEQPYSTTEPMVFGLGKKKATLPEESVGVVPDSTGVPVQLEEAAVGADVNRNPSISNGALLPDPNVEERMSIPSNDAPPTFSDAGASTDEPVYPDGKADHVAEPAMAMPTPVLAQTEAPAATTSSHSRKPSILKNGGTPPPLPPRSTSPGGPSVTYADGEAPASPISKSHIRGGSVHTTHTAGGSTFTSHDGKGAAFTNGAGTVGPNATPFENEDAAHRTGVAEAVLTEKEVAKITKSEIKDGKRMSKIIKKESKIEKQALDVAVKELASLQKIQKTAVKREAKAHSAHVKSLTVFQKQEAAFNAARTKYETAQAQLNGVSETLETTRSNARDATEKMQEKTREIETLRQNLAVDERERGAKLAELSGRKSLGHA